MWRGTKELYRELNDLVIDDARLIYRNGVDLNGLDVLNKLAKHFDPKDSGQEVGDICNILHPHYAPCKGLSKPMMTIKNGNVKRVIISRGAQMESKFPTTNS